MILYKLTDKHAKMMMNPAFGGIQSTTPGEHGTKGKAKGKTKAIRSLATNTDQKKSTTNSKKSTDTKTCEYCKGTKSWPNSLLMKD